MEWINTVKEQDNGYLVNGNMSVPKSEGNRHYEDIKLWLETNTPEPEFTDAELAQQAQDKINQEALAYLASTDWYVTRFTETGVAIPDDVTTKRVEARASII